MLYIYLDIFKPDKAFLIGSSEYLTATLLLAFLHIHSRIADIALSDFAKNSIVNQQFPASVQQHRWLSGAICTVPKGWCPKEIARLPASLEKRKKRKICSELGVDVGFP